jgi:hypothetical protein
MRDDLDKYFLNTIIKTAKPKIPFVWTDLIDEIVSTYSVPFDGGGSIEARVYVHRRNGADFKKQLETMLSSRYLIPSDKEENKYLLTKKASHAKKFSTIEDYELTMNPPLSPIKINYKKFDRGIMSFLKKQDQTFGDISHIANKFINGKQNNVIKIYRQLIHLKERDVIEIRDLPDDPMQMQDDWWGNLIGVNVNRGDKVEGLKAKLSKGYLKLSWWDRNPSKTKWLGWLVPFVLGIASTIIIQKILSISSSQPNSQKEILKPESTVLIETKSEGNSRNIHRDSLQHNKDTLIETLTK